MSADNHIVIVEDKNGLLRGYDRCIEGDYSDAEEIPVFTADTVNGAILTAEQYMSKNIVEYGYIFEFFPGSEKSEIEEKSKINSEQMKSGITVFLKGLGLDLTDQHFAKTPGRIVKAYLEIFEGLEDIDDKVKTILSTAFASKSDQMIIVKNIRVFSMCPHHFLPVEYSISAAYIPNGKVLGLSKVPRLIELLAKRPVIQEDFTEDITKSLMSINSIGSAVQVEGYHLCMRMRGVRKLEATVITSSVLGAFRDHPSARNEFFSQIRNSNF